MAFLAAGAARRAGASRVAAVTGRRAAARRAPRNLNELPPEARNAELQARRQDAAAAKTARDAAKADPAPAPTPPGGGTPAPAPAAAPLFQMPKATAAHTGGGFVLGLIAWAVGLNYLQGGMPQVRRLARAKFLNDVGG